MLYSAFDLIFDSEFELPELQPAVDGKPDIIIRNGVVPEQLDRISGEGVLYQLNESQFRLEVPNIAQYYVEKGELIIIDANPSADPASVRLFLLGTTLAALLHQRGLLPLHASSIETSTGAILFCGHSGVGKSTIAATLRQRGYRIISDDISVIAPGENGIPVVLPGYPQQKLWANVLQQMAIATANLDRIRPQLEKYSISVREEFYAAPLPIRRIYILETANNITKLEIKPIEGLVKLASLVSHTYRRKFLVQMGEGKKHTPLLMQLSTHALLSRATRPDNLHELASYVDAIEQDFCA